ncbi:MAG: PorV/PorQ family protein [Ignavibacteriales bacterium]|nr:PorV/PorQ family protein [Ignavibacteriales bacterium]
MNKIKIISAILVFFLIAAGTNLIFADGGDRKGTAGAVQLLIPVGPRGIAMGEATLANSYGIESIFWNPANLSRGGKNTEVMFEHMSYIADIGVEYGAIKTYVDGFGTIGFHIKTLDIGEIPVTTSDFPDGIGRNYTPQFFTIGATYSIMLSDRISVGLTCNYISEKIEFASATGFGFNIGLTYSNLANLKGLNFAIAMKNFGGNMKYDGSGLLVLADAQGYLRPQQYYKIESAPFELPSSVQFGLSYRFDINKQNAIETAIQFENSNFWGDMYHGGLEYAYDDMVFLRFGYHVSPNLNKLENGFEIAGGAGFKYNIGGLCVGVDYAYRDNDTFSGNHVFSLYLGL